MDRAKSRIFPILLGIVLLGALGGALWWFLEGRHWQSTDNAYVQADMAVISAKVPGYVADVPVADNQPVRAGQTLVRLVDADYRAALARAEAEVERLARARGAAGARAVAGASQIAEARAAASAAESEARRAAADAARADELLKQGFATRALVEQRRAAAEQGAAAVAQARAAVAASVAGREAAEGDAGGAGAALKAALASREAAALDLGNAVLHAPFDGIVGNRSVRPGQYARAGQQLMVVVPVQQAYLVANFKETQIAGMKVGMPVGVTLDAYPDTPLTGRIDSFAPASGSQFSVIPPENATGNFTRIVQRVPVRITLDRPLPEGVTLTPGLSARVKVDLRRAAVPGK
jgi:membrane fusion protein (multidrug efflux system)